MLRELISRFNRSLSERVSPARRPHTAPIRIYFDADSKTERARELARAAYIAGETVDISRTGIGLLVPSIRLKEKYLVGQHRELNVEVDLPTGRVSMRAIGRRYERVGDVSTDRYFVGIEITSISEHDRESYELCIRRGSGIAGNPGAKLGLGID